MSHATEMEKSQAAALLGIIARVKAATGPDRELDLATARAVGALGHAAGLPDSAFIGDHLPACGFMHYTASLDAALALVPAGFGWSIGSDGMVWVGAATGLQDGLTSEEEAATPALALCLAAIRAQLEAIQETADVG
jgi:hypothetical protein